MIYADIAICRDVAEECRRLAAEVTDPTEKQELLCIAEGWLTLPLAPEIVTALEHPELTGSGLRQPRISAKAGRPRAASWQSLSGFATHIRISHCIS
jgi:hypothetical protein